MIKIDLLSQYSIESYFFTMFSFIITDYTINCGCQELFKDAYFVICIKVIKIIRIKSIKLERKYIFLRVIIIIHGHG